MEQWLFGFASHMPGNEKASRRGVWATSGGTRDGTEFQWSRIRRLPLNRYGASPSCRSPTLEVSSDRSTRESH